MPIRLEPLAPADAIAALEARGRTLDPSFHWQERYAEDHGRAFTVAKSAGFDILGDIYNGLEAALKEGRTVRQFVDELTPLLQAKGWWGRQAATDPQTGLPTTVQLGSPRRLRLIFDVNMRVSYAAGHWANFERNRKARPFLRYVAIMDEATRPTHALHHNLVLPIDHPHWKVWSPPCGWNCRCTLQSLSQADVDRLRPMLKFEPPVIDARPWTNKVTGEVRFVPEGIDPGWDYNPGKAGWRGTINTAFAARIAAAPPELRAAGIAERVASSDFQRFLSQPEGDFAVMLLGDDVATAIQAAPKIRAVAMSADTMRKQLRNHPDMVAADYLQLPALGSAPTLAIQDGPRSVVMLRLVGSTWYHAAVKTTASGQALFMTSYRRTNPQRVAQLLARAGVTVLQDNR